MSKANVLAVIPARGGSKGLPRKNLHPLAGKPLIAHSIATAQACPSIDRTIVTTDDEEIASVAREYGAETPFLRPPELARDDTLDFPVFVHVLEWLAENEDEHPEIIVQLRPTSPLRRPEVVESSVQKLKEDPKADSVRVVCSPAQNPFKMWKFVEGSPYMQPLIDTDIPEQYNQPRQKLPQVYWQIGYVDAIRRATILEQRSMSGKNILPLVLEHANVVDIDDAVSLEIAEILIKRGAF